MSEIENRGTNEGDVVPSVRLLVGKRYFEIPRSLLAPIKDSHLAKLIDQADQLGKPDALRIERSNKYFPSIIKFLSGKLDSFIGWTRDELEGLKADAEYYGITELSDKLADLLRQEEPTEPSQRTIHKKIVICFDDQLLISRARANGVPTFCIAVDPEACKSLVDNITRIIELIQSYSGENIYGTVLGSFTEYQYGYRSWKSIRDEGIGVITLVDPWTGVLSPWLSLSENFLGQNSKTLNSKISELIVKYERQRRNNRRILDIKSYVNQDYVSKIKEDPDQSITDKSNNRIIELLVGNQYFEVPESILLSADDSYFTKLLSSNPDKIEFIIDRSERFFPAILKHLSGTKLEYLGWTRSELADLLEEATFYNLIRLRDELLVLKNDMNKFDVSSKQYHRRIEFHYDDETMMARVRSGSLPVICMWIDQNELSKFYRILDRTMDKVSFHNLRNRYGLVVRVDNYYVSSNLHMRLIEPWTLLDLSIVNIPYENINSDWLENEIFQMIMAYERSVEE